jgi:Tfp pilus assembly protein PilF
MTNLSRIEVLKEFAKQEPDNPFNWYALALEYQHIDIIKAKDLYNKLLKEHKSYLPTYFHAALFFSENGETDFAKEIYESGIALAKDQNDLHALKELKNSYQNFIFENDF